MPLAACRAEDSPTGWASRTRLCRPARRGDAQRPAVDGDRAEAVVRVRKVIKRVGPRQDQRAGLPAGIDDQAVGPAMTAPIVAVPLSTAIEGGWAAVSGGEAVLASVSTLPVPLLSSVQL